MTIWFVTRHPGAVEWAAQQGIRIDKQVAHLDVDEVQAGDVVIGILPVNLAADVCQRGAEYLHLSLNQPYELRGKELDVAAMNTCGARLEKYLIKRDN